MPTEASRGEAGRATVLIAYLQRRKQFVGDRPSNYVFVSDRGTRLDLGRVHRVFYSLSRQTGLRARFIAQLRQ